jgi:hypothetical protein
MNEEEVKLREAIKGDDFSLAVESALLLCSNFLYLRGELADAEIVLLEVLGKQSITDGYVIELNLAELYVKIDEIPRAKRFLETAQGSRVESVNNRAGELATQIEEKLAILKTID